MLDFIQRISNIRNNNGEFTAITNLVPIEVHTKI